MRAKTILVVFLAAIFTASPLFAETLILKNGQRIEGKIIEKGKDSLKIEFEGVKLVYFNSDIKSILDDSGKEITGLAESKPAQAEIASQPSSAPALSPVDEAMLIDQVLDQSGIRKQLQQIPAQISMQLAARKQEYKPEVYAILERSMTESFRANTLYQLAKDCFRKNFDAQKMQDTLTWLQSPLFRKFSGLEMNLSDPKVRAEVKEFTTSLMTKPPPEARLGLVKRFDQATNSTSLAVDIITSINRGMVTGIEKFVPVDKRVPPDKLDELLAQQRQKIEEPLKSASMISMIFLFRSVSDEELRQYISFYESDTGRWFTRLSSLAMNSAMTTAAESIGEKMIEARRQLPPAEGVNTDGKTGYQKP